MDNPQDALLVSMEHASRLYHHEAGHAVVARALGCRVRSIRMDKLAPAGAAGAAQIVRFVPILLDEPDRKPDEPEARPAAAAPAEQVPAAPAPQE